MAYHRAELDDSRTCSVPCDHEGALGSAKRTPERISALDFLLLLQRVVVSSDFLLLLQRVVVRGW